MFNLLLMKAISWSKLILFSQFDFVELQYTSVLFLYNPKNIIW